MIQYLSYLASALVLLAVYFISKPKLRGQYLIVMADLTWLTYACLTSQWALGIQSVVLLCIGLHAIKNWLGKARGTDAMIRAALIEHYGGYQMISVTSRTKKGAFKKVVPETLKYVKNDAWSALAIGLYAYRKHCL